MLKPQGIITPIITPFTQDGAFNELVFRNLIDMLIDNGVDGIFPLGTTGEFYACRASEVETIFTVAVEQVAGRIPVYAGVNHITTRGVLDLVKIAEKCNVSALSVLTPMFISQTQSELYGFYKTIAENTRLPVIVYNNQPKTNVTVSPETIARLAEIENIVGVKDSTGDFTNTAEYLRLTKDRDDFSVLLGRDTLIYAGLCHGAVGAIASCSNIAPRVTCDIYDYFMQGNMKKALEAQFRLAPLRIASNMGTFPQVIKEGLMLLGYDVGSCLSPIARITDEQLSKLRAVMKNMKLL